MQRYAGLIWAICRSCSFRDSDAADVSQVVWLRLIENLSRLREPERLKSWLAVVTRNECIRVVRRAGREIVTDVAEGPHAAIDPSMERRLVTAERHVALCEAFDVLSPRCRSLLRALAADPRPSYDEVSELLSMPIGSIGPTRQRCLECLRRELERRDPGDGRVALRAARRRPAPADRETASRRRTVTLIRSSPLRGGGDVVVERVRRRAPWIRDHHAPRSDERVATVAELSERRAAAFGRHRRGVASMHDHVDRLQTARTSAVAGPGELATKRQHDRGKLTARERLELLLDDGHVRRARPLRPPSLRGPRTGRSSPGHRRCDHRMGPHPRPRGVRVRP